MQPKAVQLFVSDVIMKDIARTSSVNVIVKELYGCQQNRNGNITKEKYVSLKLEVMILFERL